ncbi:MAG: methyltransferase family protein, partial [Solirubrobacterales bacterium]
NLNQQDDQHNSLLQLQVRFVEEPYLIRTHGDDYRAYASEVGRFVPGIGRRH